MTKSTQRARDASKAKPATRQQKNVKRTSEAPRADSGPFVKMDISPEDFFRAWSRERREALIDLLIDSLDTIDPDPDLEPDLGSGDDREGDDADLEDTADMEPSLGWTDNPKQSGLAWEGHPHSQCGEEGTSPEWPAEHPTRQPPKRRVVAPPVPTISIRDCVRVSR